MERSAAQIIAELREIPRKGDYEQALVAELDAARARESGESSESAIVVEQVLIGSDTPPETPDQAV